MKSRVVEFSLRHPYEARAVPIAADAAISTVGVFGGRLVPLVILDTSDRPDVEELIRVHGISLNPGDFKFQWGQVKGHEGSVALFLTFIRPSEAFVVIEFDVVKHGILVEQALTGKGLYIQSGRVGDRLTQDLHRPKILLEISDTGFWKVWDALFHKHLEKDFRRKGLSRSDSRRAARAAIEELRKLGSLRMRDIAT